MEQSSLCERCEQQTNENIGYLRIKGKNTRLCHECCQQFSDYMENESVAFMSSFVSKGITSDTV